MALDNLTIIGSGNGLSPTRRQAITWTNDDLSLIGPLGTNFGVILIKLQKIFHGNIFEILVYKIWLTLSSLSAPEADMYIHIQYWNRNVFTFTKSSSLSSLERVKMTHSSATGGKKFVKVTTLPFQWSVLQPHGQYWKSFKISVKSCKIRDAICRHKPQ